MNLISLYTLLWWILTWICFIFLIKRRKDIILFRKDYILFLFKKWKISLLLIAMILLSYISTLWYDPSWDIPETVIMSIFTFYFSPYCVGVMYRFYKWIHRDIIELYISIILMFFSSCWFYDAYATIFLLGYYPPMAFANLWLSPFFFLFAGNMWNLDYSKEKWIIYTHSQKDWIHFKWEPKIFSRIFLHIIPVILFMTLVFGHFLYLSILFKY